MKNKTLALAIPTYNRPDILLDNLAEMLPQLKKNNIPVYITDDSTNMETKILIEKFSDEHYSNIFYQRNEPSLGHDLNCKKVLSIPEEEYIWYLGDSNIIIDGGIKKVLQIIDNFEQDFIVVNFQGRKINKSTKYYENYLDFFEDIAWHTTLTGVTIYKREAIFNTDYKKYENSNFMQLGIILEENVGKTNGIRWENERLIKPNKNKIKTGSYWSKKVFDVFSQDWYDFVMSLPDDYPYDSKIKVIKNHSDETGIFKVKNLLYLRVTGILTFDIFEKFKETLEYTASVDLKVIEFISKIPISLIRPFYNLRVYYKKLGNIKKLIRIE